MISHQTKSEESDNEDNWSILLFQDASTRVVQVKTVLKLCISVLILLAINDAYFYARPPISELLVGVTIFLCLFLFVTGDTTNIVAGMMLWTVTLIASYAAWKFNGLYDSAMFIFPCILIFASLLGGKILILPLAVYMLSVFYFLAYAHSSGLLEGSVVDPVFVWRKANNLAILLIVYGVGIHMTTSYIKRLVSQLVYKQNESTKIQLKSEQLIFYDHLTNLPNERLCQKKLPALLESSRINNMLVGFVTLDFDNFKWINSSLGHLIGDEIICYQADRLAKLSQKNISLFRSAGNEFIFIMLATDYQEISEYSQQILHAVSRPFQVKSYDVEMSSKIGISIAPFDGDDYGELRQKSHTALSRSKEGEDNTFRFFEIEMEDYVKKRLKMVQDLKRAIELREFELYYQPKIDLADQSIVGAEALIRWNKEGRKLISPVEFIPIAEESGLISEIGKWALEQACVDCKVWHEVGARNISVAVNLSPIQFKRGNLPNIVLRALKQVGLDASFLELEITESLFIDDTSQIKEQIHQISKKGVSIAIDDFGTGYSNLNYLTKFNASTLKIDMSFVRDMLASKQQQHMVQAIIEMSKVMALDNVAEGVEDYDTYQILKDLGCGFGQGYYWSKPLPNKEFLKLLTNGSNH